MTSIASSFAIRTRDAGSLCWQTSHVNMLFMQLPSRVRTFLATQFGTGQFREPTLARLSQLKRTETKVCVLERR
jgi:hypothetical protein